MHSPAAVRVFLGAFVVAASFTEAFVSRRLTQESIAGYRPRTQVTDHAAIDLDQAKISERLGLGDMLNAFRVYSKGGHSKSYAEVTISPTVSSKSYAKGTQVTGLTELDGTVSGKLLEDVYWGNMPADGSGKVTVKIQYMTSDVQAKYVDCQVGALYRFGEANRNGCFAESGTLSFVPLDSTNVVDQYKYSYDIRQGNKNARTIRGFSLSADEKMRPAPGASFFEEFQLFLDYYGDKDYADKWVMAAYGRNATNFSSGRGEADFGPMRGSSNPGRSEAFKKGTTLLNIWMYVVRELNDAITDCHVQCDVSTCNDDPVYALDEAVAFYTGSLEGMDGKGDGQLMYNLADARALDFRTAGYLSIDEEGTSYVNHEIMFWFQEMQEALLSKNADGTGQCNAARIIKDNIVELMKIPLVQTILRTAYTRSMEANEQPEKTEAEGATAAAALLPFLHDCHPAAAQTIYNQMGIGSDPDSVDFSRVKSTLENVYSCLGVSCIQIGGIWDGDEYKPGAEPCDDGLNVLDRSPSSSQNGNNLGSTQGSNENIDDESSSRGVLIVVLVAVLVAGILLGCVVFRRFRRREGKQIAGPVAETNIAAVSAVSDTDLT